MSPTTAAGVRAGARMCLALPDVRTRGTFGYRFSFVCETLSVVGSLSGLPRGFGQRGFRGGEHIRRCLCFLCVHARQKNAQGNELAHRQIPLAHASLPRKASCSAAAAARPVSEASRKSSRRFITSSRSACKLRLRSSNSANRNKFTLQIWSYTNPG